MNGQLGLGFVFTVRDMASGRMRQLEGTFRSLDERVGLGAARIERAFQRMGLALGVFSAGAATVAAGLALTGVAARFETAVAQVAAVSGATATELELLRDAALEAGIATQFSPTEAAMGLRELTQVGYSARDSMQLLIPVLDLAAASMGQLSPQQAAGLAAQTLHAFGLEVDDAARSVDQLMQAANLFALDSQELAMALGIASRGAQSMHQSLGETLSALGLVKNVIPGIERASTAVAVSMERMTAPRTQRALRSVGVEVVDSAGRFRQFLDVVQELGPALEHMTDAQRSAFLLETFGHHAMGGLSALMTALREGVPTAEGAIPGAEGVRHLREQFEHADGAAAHFREQMLGTFEGQQRLLMGSLETLGILAGQPFLELFRPVVGAIVDAVNGVIAVFRALPAPVLRSLAGLTTVLGGFVSLVGAALAGQASIAILTLALEAAGVTLAGLAVTFAAPTAAAAALGLAFVAVRTAFDRNVGGIADAAASASRAAAHGWEARGARVLG